MPSLIEGDDRQTVKRTVPKPSNKIHAVGVAKLYIAYPDKQRWTYTGLQGAVVLANDLVGHTYWLKLVDISPANRGVIWDQEIYDTFSYNQDRVFFHSFELEQCLAGLSFADDKEAKKFKQKMDEREKNAHKNTRSKPFMNAQTGAESRHTEAKSHSRLGGIGNLLHVGHRHSSGSHHGAASHQGPPQSIIPPKDVSMASPTAPSSRSRANVVEGVDQQLLDELLTLGLTEDQLAENAEFIKMYVQQKKSNTPSEEPKIKSSIPPLPPISPQHTGNTAAAKRGPAPALPPARRTPTRPETQRPPSPERTPSPPQPKFRAPPPLSNAGKFAVTEPDSPPAPSRNRAQSNTIVGPPPPPRPPKTPMDESPAPGPTRFGVPPPFSAERAVPPPPPSRGAGPPAPPPREPSVSQPPPPPPARNSSTRSNKDSGGHAVPPASVPPAPVRNTSVRGERANTSHAVPPATAAPPPLPPKTPNEPPPPTRNPLPPPLPSSRDSPSAPLPPPTRDSQNTPLPPPPPPFRNMSTAPPPPPLPNASKTSAPPPPPLPSSGAPPPPPLPATAGPPPPPLPPGIEPAPANIPALPQTGGRGGLLADIRGGARLKKVSEAEKRDRSAAAVGGSSGDVSGAAPSPAAAGDAGGLAGALASALAARKSKVSTSDDEDDKDDW